MNKLDIILALLGVLVVGLFIYERMARALLSLLMIWLATFITLFLYDSLGFILQGMFDGTDAKTQGIAFLFLFFVFLIIEYAIVRYLFPDLTLPKIGFLDYLMGLVLGAMVAAIIISLVLNTLGYMASEPWPKDVVGWSGFSSNVQNSIFRPNARQIFAAYRSTFTPFFRPYLPAILLSY